MVSDRWDAYYMSEAYLASTMSKDSTQVGAAIIGPDGEVRMKGFNGPPRGVEDLPERFERPEKYLFASHAEQNAIAFCAREGVRTKDCTIYVTHHPCSSCARSIIQAGIRCVVVSDGKTSMPADEFRAATEMFREAGVEVRNLEGIKVVTGKSLTSISMPGASFKTGQEIEFNGATYRLERVRR